MNSRRYMPKPGSVPARAIAWLHTQPPGAEVTTDVLATAAGFNRKNATAFLEPAVKGRALARRSTRQHDPRSPMLWKLGEKAPTAEEMQKLAEARTVVMNRPATVPAPAPAPEPAAPITRAARSVFEYRPEERRQVMEAPVPAPGSFLEEWRRKRGQGS